ncbi:helicase HerA domain-containing protein [Natrialbaceae archaeon A-chndr2]
MKTIRRPVVNSTGEYLEIGEAMLAVIEVSSVSFELQTDRDEGVAHSFYQDLLDAISEPVYLHSRQRTSTLDSYLEGFDPISGLKTRQEDYYRYCYELFADGVGVTDHYLILRETPRSSSQTTTERLETRLQNMLTRLHATDFQADHVAGDQLHRFADRELNQDPKVSPRYSTVPSTDSDEFRKTVYVGEFPSQLRFGWPATLLNLEGLVDITQVIRPQDSKTVTNRLNRLADWLEVEILSFLSNGFHGFNTLERLLEDAEWVLQQLRDHDSRVHEYGAYITVHGASKEAVEATYNRVDTQLQLLGIQTGSTMFRTDQAYYTDSSFHRDRLDQVSLMPSESVATGFPFGTRPLTRNGVVYGLDQVEETPVLLDRFSWDSHSMAVMGTQGSGKTYWTQLELLRAACIYPDLRIIVVDPKLEYHDVIETLGGVTQIIQQGLVYDLDERITCFQPEQRGILDHDDSVVELLGQIYAAVSKNRENTIVVVDEAHRVFEHPTGRSLLNRFVLEARNINTAVQMVTQSAGHFTKYEEGQDILDNVPARAFFRHEDVSKALHDYNVLSEKEQRRVSTFPSAKNAGYSEALLHLPGQKRIHLRVDSTQKEHQIIEDNLEEETYQSEHTETICESPERIGTDELGSIMADREYFKRSANRLLKKEYLR